jgi:hypothetical protein
MNDTTDKIIRLYRYLSAEAAIKTIEARALLVGRPKEFNDPFEWRLGVHNIDQPSPHEIEKEKQRNEKLIDFLSETFGIVCFSSVLDEPALWSHYAKSHHGIVLEVECYRKDMIEVTYRTNELPQVPANYGEKPLDDKSVNILKGVFKNQVRQKAPCWSYEKEWRGIVELNSCQVSGGKYFQKLNNDDITRVIVGCRSPISPNYIRQALETNGWKTNLVAKAQLSSQNYKIEVP